VTHGTTSKLSPWNGKVLLSPDEGEDHMRTYLKYLAAGLSALAELIDAYADLAS
jgi:hypothetical protein